jgi:hypothetical protein
MLFVLAFSHPIANVLPQFRDLRAFDCYKLYYTKREEAQQIFDREVLKKSSTGFASYIDVRGICSNFSIALIMLF